MFRSTFALLLSVLVGETSAFLPIVVVPETRNAVLAIRYAEEEKPVGHLENMDPEPFESDSDCPGLKKGADTWPSSMQNPNVQAPGDPETPGVGRAELPPYTREPTIGFGSGPSDCPGLPPDSSAGIPPFIQEPRVP